jgi:ABC-type tungstate transport system permease subunit
MNNVFNMLGAIKNPQNIVQQAMNNNQIMQNPIARNTIEMMQKGDSKGLESMARNLCREKGMDPDELLKQVKQQFGL